MSSNPAGVAPYGSLSDVLVGRQAELALLRTAIAAAPSLALIEGEAGIGKSRLVGELFATPELAGTRRLVGQCEQLQEPLPLSPLLDAFRMAGDELARARPANPVTGALAPLLPEIAEHLPPPLPPLHDQRAERHRVFRAAVALLEHLSPLVLVLEDVHWADGGTHDFLAFLAAHQPRDLSVILTVRTESGLLPIREAFARAPSGPARVVTLAPLTRPEADELARRILQTDLPGTFAALLYEKTGGIPFVVEELLRTLLERLPANEIPGRPDVLTGLAVPTVLRDVVLQRLSSLDDPVREILEAAAVIGMTPDDRILSEVTERDPAEVAKALGRAQAAGLLHEKDGGCRFRHALARQIVYESVAVSGRRWLHLRTARALESAAGPKPVARLAHHYRLAGRTADFVGHAEAAADTALFHGNDATAARFLLQALEIGELSGEVRVRLAVKLGRSAVDGLAHAEAVPILERLLATEPLPAHLRGELRFALGRLLRQHGEARAGYLQIESAVGDLGDRPALLGRALAVLAAPETIVDRHVSEHAARRRPGHRRRGTHRQGLAASGAGRSGELAADRRAAARRRAQGRAEGARPRLPQLGPGRPARRAPRPRRVPAGRGPPGGGPGGVPAGGGGRRAGHGRRGPRGGALGRAGAPDPPAVGGGGHLRHLRRRVAGLAAAAGLAAGGDGAGRGGGGVPGRGDRDRLAGGGRVAAHGGAGDAGAAAADLGRRGGGGRACHCGARAGTGQGELGVGRGNRPDPDRRPHHIGCPASLGRPGHHLRHRPGHRLRHRPGHRLWHRLWHRPGC